MHLRLLFIVVTLFFFCNANAQLNLNVKASFNNLFRYGNGNEYSGMNKFQKEYFEEIAEGRIDVNDIIFGMRYELSEPIEYGTNFKGIKKRYIEYNNRNLGLGVRAGDFYDIFSRGLSLNVFEERSLAYDTGIDGIRLKYDKTFGKKKPVKLEAQVIGGNLNYSDFLQPDRIESYKIRNANFRISPVRQVTIGAGYVYSKGKIPNAFDTTDITVDLPEFNLALNFSDFQFYAGYVWKSLRSDRSQLFPTGLSTRGDGFYSAVSYSTGSFAATLEYKNYRFDLTNPDNRSVDRPTKMLPFQNPPTAVKEHTSTLISRNPHVVNFNDEVGGQLDLLYVASDKLTFNFNTAVASRHYRYEDIEPSVSNYQWKRVERSFDLIPDFDKAFSPYWEIYTEAEYYATDEILTKLAFSRQSQVLFNDFFPESSETILTTTIPAEFRYRINNEYAIKLSVEQQWQYNSIRTGDKKLMNQLITLNLTKSPELSFSISGEFTNDDEEPTGKKSWFIGEVLYKLNTTNSITLSYGSERGGLKCTNGICRFVNPFDGFRMSVQSIF
ncbi:MAG: DUF6029 family protein [Ignavibacteriaceae bacterium]|jgi:hypothetical protein|nr:MAG: hypothetical protein EDM69_06475 [Chlorobiota bacterium]KXK06339.1 MAG: hypothetical protein UZ04_CHB001000341 [Chlorobi bacterium OLB4]MBV6399148.1 hypothetical protein [Ignavibacteria bacterium]MCC6885405.1 hypothetical protein [Ignavibacteriales bacterium]MCE7953648.1 hypothetical protein [Chlorobi bacterium CHB7]MDL1887462.1 hypothetical protein [Ignavibacteria bacterium CHB1]MEB2329936.1 DUF6029 family protein [Ignavibacteriaceae bacterium]